VSVRERSLITAPANCIDSIESCKAQIFTDSETVGDCRCRRPEATDLLPSIGDSFQGFDDGSIANDIRQHQ